MKYEILNDFIDRHNSTIYVKGDVITFTEERVNEIKDKEKEINLKLIRKAKTKKVEVE